MLTVWRWLYARWYYLWGTMYRYWGHRNGDTAEYLRAIDNFTYAIALDPRFAQAYLDRGILYWREVDHPRRAILDLDQAENLNPTLAEARFNRGVAYQQLGEYANAIADFDWYLQHGTHPDWCEYAEKMIVELVEWVTPEETYES